MACMARGRRSSRHVPPSHPPSPPLLTLPSQPFLHTLPPCLPTLHSHPAVALGQAVATIFPSGTLDDLQFDLASARRGSGGAVMGRYIQFLGDELSRTRMAYLYHASDAYVSASMAEAFQMPLAEALAAGLPLIAPMGGATEEFVTRDAAVLVAASIEARQRGEGVLLKVDEQQLAEAMLRVFRNESAPLAATRGPLWAAAKLSMSHSADLLLAALMEEGTAVEEPHCEDLPGHQG